MSDPKPRLSADPSAMRRTRLRALLIGAVSVTPLAAQPLPVDNDATVARALVAAGQALPLQQVIDRARTRQPGRMIDAELYRDRDDGRFIYEIYILDGAGDIWELEYDAATGALIEHEQEDH